LQGGIKREFFSLSWPPKKEADKNARPTQKRKWNGREELLAFSQCSLEDGIIPDPPSRLSKLTLRSGLPL